MGALKQYYQPPRILLDSRAQPLMLGKITMVGLRLTDADLEPCLILTSMGKLKKVQGITKHIVVIQVNPIKLTYYTMIRAMEWLRRLHCMMC